MKDNGSTELYKKLAQYFINEEMHARYMRKIPKIDNENYEIFIKEGLERLCNELPSNLTEETKKKIKGLLTSKDMIDKLRKIHYKIYEHIQSFRSFTHKALSGEDESSTIYYYINSAGKKSCNLYVPQIDKAICDHQLAMVENFLNSDMPTQKIEIKGVDPHFKDIRIDKSTTHHVQFLVSIARGEYEAYISQVFYWDMRDAENKGENWNFNPSKEAKEIMDGFANCVVRGYIEFIKEKAKGVPSPWKEVDSSVTYKEPKKYGPGTFAIPQEKSTFGKLMGFLLGSEPDEVKFIPAAENQPSSTNSSHPKAIEGPGGSSPEQSTKTFQEKEAEREKKINSSNSKWERFIWRGGLKGLIARNLTITSALIIGGTITAASFYTGGLAALPIIAMANPGVNLIIAESVAALGIGAIFGKCINYTTTSVDSKNTYTEKEQNSNHAAKEQMRKQGQSKNQSLH